MGSILSGIVRLIEWTLLTPLLLLLGLLLWNVGLPMVALMIPNAHAVVTHRPGEEVIAQFDHPNAPLRIAVDLRALGAEVRFPYDFDQTRSLTAEKGWRGSPDGWQATIRGNPSGMTGADLGCRAAVETRTGVDPDLGLDVLAPRASHSRAWCGTAGAAALHAVHIACFPAHCRLWRTASDWRLSWVLWFDEARLSDWRHLVRDLDRATRIIGAGDIRA